MFQEGLSPRRADAGDGIQRRGHALFRAPLAVGGDGKTVRLVADALDEIQRLRMAQQQRIGFVREEQLLVLLRQSDNGYFAEQAYFL